MRKYLSFFIAAVFAAGTLSACGGGSTVPQDNTSQEAGDLSTSQEAEDLSTSQEAGDLSIVTTIFPEYDWVMNILGDNPAGAEVTMLLDTGVDLHSYQPTAQDIVKISESDVFIYVGGESDEWVDDVLAGAANEDLIAINLLDSLGDAVKEEEIVEGMEADEHEHDEDEEHEDEEHADEEHEDEEHADEEHEHEGPEYDEHVWLSLRNAAALTNVIAEAISTADPANADVYSGNAEAYTAQMEALDAEYEKAVEEASVHTLLFGDRFPFRYMTDDYGLEYYAAFVGCSAESEASFETITFLAGKVDELSLGTVMTIEGNDHRIAETIIENTETKDQKILTMDSMQSTTAQEVENGKNYLSVMQDNLSVLKEALK